MLTFGITKAKAKLKFGVRHLCKHDCERSSVQLISIRKRKRINILGELISLQFPCQWYCKTTESHRQFELCDLMIATNLDNSSSKSISKTKSQLHLCFYCIKLTEQELKQRFVTGLQETPSALYSTCFSQPCFGSEIHAITRKSCSFCS